MFLVHMMKIIMSMVYAISESKKPTMRTNNQTMPPRLTKVNRAPHLYTKEVRVVYILNYVSFS